MNDKIEAILKSPLTIPAVIGVTSFASGLGLGFFLGKKKAIEIDVHVHELPAIVEMDIEETEEGDESETTRPPRVIIEAKDAVEQGIVRINDLSELRPSMLSDDEDQVIEASEEVIEAVEENDIIVLEQSSAVAWDWEEELEHRTETAPYILHKEEFYADEKNYSQISLTYYTGDDTLADEDDAPVYNHSGVVGALDFGHGSGQENVVYIRNDERKAEYEVTRIDGHYSIEILGYEMEKSMEATDLKHSKHMKFRME